VGDLARIGIRGGKKTPVSGLHMAGSHGDIDEFSRDILRRYDYEEIADKILSNTPLNFRDVFRLFADATFPIQLKLVELRGCKPTYKSPSPVVLLPLGSWFRQFDDVSILSLASNFLQNVQQDQFFVVFDEINYECLDGRFGELAREILISRPGLSLIAPSAEDIISWIVRHDGMSSPAIQIVKLVRLLGLLKKAGFSHLCPSSKPELVKLVHQAGFPAHMITYIDQFDTMDGLAKELLDINELSGVCGMVDLWSPGLSSGRAKGLSYAPVDVLLLCTLAVGTLCLDNVPARRASSSFFSLDALTLAPYCGANDFGLGAVDLGAAALFQVQPFDTLQEISSRF